MENYILTTQRLFLRKIGPQDLDDLFEMDADPAVHTYIENNPVTSKEQVVQVIAMLNKQYEENGIARWAVVDRQTHECIGWAGLKYFRTPLNHHKDFYELGYRFKQKHWNKGYATEAGKAIIAYGFTCYDIGSIYAITHPENENSMKVLRKLGFEFIESFDDDGQLINWFELKRTTMDNLPAQDNTPR